MLIVLVVNRSRGGCLGARCFARIPGPRERAQKRFPKLNIAPDPAFCDGVWRIYTPEMQILRPAPRVESLCEFSRVESLFTELPAVLEL